MATGTVKWFNAVKGYGLIATEGVRSDVFVHINALRNSGLRGLADGQRVRFDVEHCRDGRDNAVNISLA